MLYEVITSPTQVDPKGHLSFLLIWVLIALLPTLGLLLWSVLTMENFHLVWNPTQVLGSHFRSPFFIDRRGELDQFVALRRGQGQELDAMSGGGGDFILLLLLCRLPGAGAFLFDRLA